MTIDRYNPADIEQKWYRFWLDHNLFSPTMAPGAEPFCVVIPPPNVTGSLHMGHGWGSTVQDILIRWKRMQGFNTLWVPGTDHAGIATQWMVERDLRQRGLSKEALGREKFAEAVWKFKEESHGTIVGQLSRLGVSCDWSRERFTLDEGLSRAVRHVFVQLFDEGLIYRANRMISWCSRCLTALSDLEVEHQESQGSLWHIRYPLAEGDGGVTVATTRPETMLGDTAVAVHPEDERYRHLVGKSLRLPLAERSIPVIADDHVDPAFGSGAVKVTPGHDPNDFDIGRRHDLPLINIFNPNGTLNENAPPAYRNMDRFAARKRIVADLEALGLLTRVEKHAHAVGTCDRCATVVEPRVSLQWFVRMGEMAAAAVEAVRDKRILLLPQYQEKIFFEWMNNIQDWCVSRQLWWGHRIPVWYCGACQAVIASEDEVTACRACGGTELTQDEDVLDTWFSSGLWPFSTMGWPEETEDLRTFYPTAVLVTGYDILFFWVARMAMLGLKFMNAVPFREVFLHGLLRDAAGQKMSKTKGNGLDPLEMIDVYGADALRFTLAAGTVPGHDQVLQESNIEGYRNFVNKIWNATRFTLGHLERLGPPPPPETVTPGLFDRWILGRLSEVAEEANRMMEERRLNAACKGLYGFVWHEFCDWYVEIVKPALAGELGAVPQAAAHATLHTVLEAILRLLHPYMPFVTEELWQRLPGREGSIMTQPYPGGAESTAAAPGTIAEASQIIDLIQTVRTVRGENGVKPKQRVDLVVAAPQALRGVIAREAAVFRSLAGVADLALVERFGEREGYGHGVGSGFEVFVSLAGMIDVAQERQRLGRELQKTRERITQLESKLGNPAFVGKAPENLVAKNRDELADLQLQIYKLDQSLNQLPAS